MEERKPVENQLDGLDSEIISSIEHSPPIRQHFAVEQGVILMISKAGLSETLMWHARAGQARRVASMLSPRDAALVEAYARECDDSARAGSIDGARVDARRSVEIQRRDDRSFRAPAKSCGEATGIGAPIDRLTFLRGRITSEEPCPSKARVKPAGAKEERVL